MAGVEIRDGIPFCRKCGKEVALYRAYANKCQCDKHGKKAVLNTRKTQKEPRQQEQNK